MHNNYPVGHELLTQKLERICIICDNYKICIIESIILPYFPNPPAVRRYCQRKRMRYATNFDTLYTIITIFGELIILCNTKI